MNWEEVCHYIAQGAVNISEGHTTIEAGSRVHTAMNVFCEMVTVGVVKYDAAGFKSVGGSDDAT